MGASLRCLFSSGPSLLIFTPPVSKVLCILAGRTLSLPVYQNAHVNSVARRFIPFDVYFIFSVPLLTFINTKANIC